MNIKAVSSDRDIYNFNSSGIGDSWLIGTDTTDAANAFKNGVDGCPVNLTIPRDLTDENGETKPVEVIGQYAFCKCAYNDENGQTRKLTLTRQVKVIKPEGFGWLWDLEEFTVEDGSVLETIESYGLEYIGLNGLSRTTLTLPSTLSSVFEDGIYDCDRFGVIIYCGSHHLSNSSELAIPTDEPTVVKVSSEYPSGQRIFGRVPDRDSLDEVAEACSKMEDRPHFFTVEVDGGCQVTGYGNNVSRWCPPNLNIPEVINGSNVIAINESAFANCDTKGPISLPSTLQRVGASAFANTSFVTAVVADSLELDVGEAAFQGCGKEALKPISVNLPENITLGNRAFAGAKIGEVNIFSIYNKL